jgi:hypothetical protein
MRLLLKGNYSPRGANSSSHTAGEGRFVDSLVDDVKPLVLELLRQTRAGE